MADTRDISGQAGAEPQGVVVTISSLDLREITAGSKALTEALADSDLMAKPNWSAEVSARVLSAAYSARAF